MQFQESMEEQVVKYDVSRFEKLQSIGKNLMLMSKGSAKRGCCQKKRELQNQQVSNI